MQFIKPYIYNEKTEYLDFLVGFYSKCFMVEISLFRKSKDNAVSDFQLLDMCLKDPEIKEFIDKIRGEE